MGCEGSYFLNALVGLLCQYPIGAPKADWKIASALSCEAVKLLLQVGIVCDCPTRNRYRFQPRKSSHKKKWKCRVLRLIWTFG